jgi:hypothetical protein
MRGKFLDIRILLLDFCGANFLEKATVMAKAMVWRLLPALLLLWSATGQEQAEQSGPPVEEPISAKSE